MKKLLLVLFILGFVFAGNALADEVVLGTMTVLDMTVFSPDPDPCDVIFNFVTDSAQEYVFFATADGIKLNLAIWKAALDGVPLRAQLSYTIIPLVIQIDWVNWPA